MELAAYQNQALSTANMNLKKPEALSNWCMGLAGEAGELIDLIKKSLFHGHELDKDKAQKELGDVLWYLSLLCSELGMSLEEVAERNLVKLRKRYAEGFSQEASRNREEYKIGGTI